MNVTAYEKTDDQAHSCATCGALIEPGERYIYAPSVDLCYCFKHERV